LELRHRHAVLVGGEHFAERDLNLVQRRAREQLALNSQLKHSRHGVRAGRPVPCPPNGVTQLGGEIVQRVHAFRGRRGDRRQRVQKGFDLGVRDGMGCVLRLVAATAEEGHSPARELRQLAFRWPGERLAVGVDRRRQHDVPDGAEQLHTGQRNPFAEGDPVGQPVQQAHPAVLARRPVAERVPRAAGGVGRCLNPGVDASRPVQVDRDQPGPARLQRDTRPPLRVGKVDTVEQARQRCHVIRRVQVGQRAPALPVFRHRWQGKHVQAGLAVGEQGLR